MNWDTMGFPGALPAEIENPTTTGAELPADLVTEGSTVSRDDVAPLLKPSASPADLPAAGLFPGYAPHNAGTPHDTGERP